jgi:hypothetical protein
MRSILRCWSGLCSEDGAGDAFSTSPALVRQSGLAVEDGVVDQAQVHPSALLVEEAASLAQQHGHDAHREPVDQVRPA